MPVLSSTQSNYGYMSESINHKNQQMSGRTEGLGKPITPTTVWKKHSGNKNLPRETGSEVNVKQPVEQRKINVSVEPSTTGIEKSGIDGIEKSVVEKVEEKILEQFERLKFISTSMIKHFERDNAYISASSKAGGLPYNFGHREYITRERLRHCFEHREALIIEIIKSGIQEKIENINNASLLSGSANEEQMVSRLPIITEEFKQLCGKYLARLVQDAAGINEQLGLNIGYYPGNCDNIDVIIIKTEGAENESEIEVSFCIDELDFMAEIERRVINELDDIEVEIESIQIEHGKNGFDMTPEDSKELSKKFNQWGERIKGIINSEKEQMYNNLTAHNLVWGGTETPLQSDIINGNCTVSLLPPENEQSLYDSPSPESISFRYVRLCEDAMDKLRKRIRTLNYGGSYQISMFGIDKCDVQDVQKGTGADAEATTKFRTSTVTAKTLTHGNTHPQESEAPTEVVHETLDQTTGTDDNDGTTLKPCEAPLSGEFGRGTPAEDDLVNTFINRLNKLTRKLEDKLVLELASMSYDVPKKVYNNRFSKEFLKHRKELLKLIRENIKKIDSNPSDYRAPHSIKMRLWTPCKRAIDNLNHPYITTINRIYNLNISKIENKCAQELEKLSVKSLGHPQQPCKTAGESIRSRLQNQEPSRLVGPAPLKTGNKQYLEDSGVPSGASRPGNFVSDVIIGGGAMLSRALSHQRLVDTYNWITGTGTEPISTSLLSQEQPAATAVTSQSNKNPVHEAPYMHPDSLNMAGAWGADKTPMIGSGQSICINNMDNSTLELASVLASKASGQKIVPNVTTPFSSPDPASAIHNNPASYLLASSATLMLTAMLSAKFKDLMTNGQNQQLDVSWTPENILDIAILQEYGFHKDHPRTLPSGFINDVLNSPVVGINSGSENFEINGNGELAIKEGKPKREFLSLLLRGLAKDCRKYSTATGSTDNGQNAISDQALAEQIRKQYPDASPGDRAILHRAITLKDQQKTTWKESVTGSSWPANRKDQIGKMYELLNPVVRSRGQESTAEAKSGSRKRIPAAMQVIRELKGQNLQQAKEQFFRLSPSEMQTAIDRLIEEPDICKFDQSEALYQEVTKGLSGLLTGREREEHILQQTRKLSKTLGLPNAAFSGDKLNEMELRTFEDKFALMKKTKRDMELNKLKKNKKSMQNIRAEFALMKKTRQSIELKKELESKLDNDEHTLKQKAWGLLAYQYDIKVGVKRELKSQIDLQVRLFREKLADTPDEAQMLSQCIPELLGTRKFTCYEKSLSQDGLPNKLAVPYQQRHYTGSEIDSMLKKYREIKATVDSRYPVVFGRDDEIATLKTDIISSASLECLGALLRSKSEWSEDKLANTIDSLLQKERVKEANPDIS